MFNHSLEDFSKHLVLGKSHSITSTSVYKRAMLTGYLSIMVLGINVFYLVFDSLHGIIDSALYYLTLINFTIISFFLNRTGRYIFAKYLLLLSTLLIIVLFSLTEPVDSGNYFNFFPVIVASFALFGYNQISKGVIFSLISLLVFIIIYNFDINMLPKRPTSKEITELYFIIHFFIAVIATILIIVFLIKLNQTIEKNLIHKDQNLIRITEDLKESQQRFELAISGSNAGIYDWDISRNIIYHSPTWKRLLGYEENELEEFDIERFYEFIHPDDRDKAKTILDSHLSEGSPYSTEFRFKTKGGDYQWFSDSGQALWNEKGVPIRMVGSIIKIHERKVAEERIKKQNRMLEKTNLELDRFVYSASHDIRSPLTSILGLINIAQRTDNLEEIEECHRLMKSRISRLDDFLEDILDFSRNIRIEKKLKEINLHYFIEEIISANDFGDNMDSIDIRLMIPQDFEVISDPVRLKVIIKNIISNAIKFSNTLKEECWLRISALRVDSNFQLIFEDNGEGIRKDLEAKIFDMFYRASEKSKGSGLGLYIVKEMVEKLNGMIKVYSTYGEGSRFIVELPDHRFARRAQETLTEQIVNS